MRALWTGAGLIDVETHEIGVSRTYTDFEEFWAINLTGSNLASFIAATPPADVARLKERLRARLPGDASGRVTVSGHANVVKGRVPA